MVIDTYNGYIRIGLTSGLIVSFGGETGGTPLRDFPESSAYKNEASKWRPNPDTKPMKTKNFNRIFKILLCKLRPWRWAPQTKFHSSPLYTHGGRPRSHCTPAQIYRSITVAAYGQNGIRADWPTWQQWPKQRLLIQPSVAESHRQHVKPWFE